MENGCCLNKKFIITCLSYVYFTLLLAYMIDIPFLNYQLPQIQEINEITIF